MGKKIYAVECDPEHYDYTMYYGDDMAEEDGIWAGGNRNYSEVNKDLREAVSRVLQDAYCDIDNIRDDYTDENNEITDMAEYEKAVDEVIRDYFKKESKEPLTEEEINTLISLSEDYSHCTGYEENGIICKVLTILTGKNYLEGTIKGSCQGDWLEIIYPEERKAMIPWIQAVWFATGTEFKITCDSYDEEPDLSEVDVYYDYTELWKPEDIKKWIAENNHAEVEDVVVKKISKTHHITTYDYEEI